MVMKRKLEIDGGVMRWTDRHVKLGDRRVIERVKCGVSRVKW